MEQIKRDEKSDSLTDGLHIGYSVVMILYYVTQCQVFSFCASFNTKRTNSTPVTSICTKPPNTHLTFFCVTAFIIIIILF